MKKKSTQLLVVSLSMAMTASLLAPAKPAQAAKVKFNVKKLTLTVGKKKTLKLKNTKKRVKWSIKSGKGKIKLQKKKKTSVVVLAKKAGNAKVMAKIGNKKYICQVVVKAAANQSDNADTQPAGTDATAADTSNGSANGANPGTSGNTSGKVKPKVTPAAEPDETDEPDDPDEPDEPDETEKPTVTPEAEESAKPTVTPDAEETATPTVTPDAEETVSPEETVNPTETVKPEETVQPTETDEPDEPESSTKPSVTQSPDETEAPEETTKPGETQKPSATVIPDPDEPVEKNAEDVQNLKGLIAAQIEKGAAVSENIEDETVYHWDDAGRLSEIYWKKCGVSGSDMQDFNKFPALTVLDVNGNNISGTFYINNLENLKELKCYDNRIDKLDTASNKNLVELECRNNVIGNAINLENCENLEKVYCSKNKLTEINVSGCNNLQEIDCSENLFEKLDVSNLPALKILDCSHNALKDDNLNLTGSTGLVQLNCSLNGRNSDIFTFDFTGFDKLEEFDCHGEYEEDGVSADDYMDLDLSSCKSLKTINCSYRPISSLLVYDLPNLEVIDANGCGLGSIEVTGDVKLKVLKISDNEIENLEFPEENEITTLDMNGSSMVENINFTVLTKLETLNLSDSFFPVLDFSKCVNLKEILASNTDFGNVDEVEDNDDVPPVDIDLSACIKLEKIDFAKLNVNVLTLPENDTVKDLILESARAVQIVNLDKQTGLVTLDITGTGITALDVSANTKLEQIVCSATQKNGLTGVSESCTVKVIDTDDTDSDGDDEDDGSDEGDGDSGTDVDDGDDSEEE